MKISRLSLIQIKIINRFFCSNSNSISTSNRPIVFRSLQEFQNFRKNLQTQSLGFVPTMGALHAGHLTLTQHARRKNEYVVVSIFVNPKQFAPHEDFNKYPRQLESDVELLAENNVDFVFAPEAKDLYSPNFCTYVVPEGFDELSEGAARPRFFRGVATVVTKLFNIIKPTNAYFGQKDAMQCVVVKRIVNDLNMDVNIHVVPTVRDRDGLALSSRNVYLTPEERRAAPVLYRALMALKQKYFAELVRESDSKRVSRKILIATAVEIIKQQPLVHTVEYISVANKEDMQELDYVDENGAVVSLAVKLGNVRLIDNIWL